MEHISIVGVSVLDNIVLKHDRVDEMLIQDFQYFFLFYFSINLLDFPKSSRDNDHQFQILFRFQLEYTFFFQFHRHNEVVLWSLFHLK